MARRKNSNPSYSEHPGSGVERLRMAAEILLREDKRTESTIWLAILVRAAIPIALANRTRALGGVAKSLQRTACQLPLLEPVPPSNVIDMSEWITRKQRERALEANATE